MATSTCTFGGRTHYNDGWAYTSFSTAATYGHAGLGKYSSGQYRYTVLKFTTAAFSGAATSLTFKISTCADTAGTVTYEYALSTKAPTFASGGGTVAGANSEYNSAISSTYLVASSSSSVTNSAPSNSSSTGGYKAQTLTISSSAIKPSTTYYIWMRCNSTQSIYYGNTSVTGTISAYVTYTSVSYSKPSLSKTSVGGYYGGATFSVGAGSSYPYVYMGWSSNGEFWLKGTSGSASTISTDADTSSTSTKTLYVFRCNADLGQPISSPGSSYLASVKVYRYGAKIYNHTSSASQYDWNSGDPCSYSGYELLGFTTSSSSYSPTYDSTEINGRTVYAIYYKDAESSNATKYWYRGSSSRRSTTQTTTVAAQYLYGTSSSRGGGTSYSYTSSTAPTASTITCASNSSYDLIGWTTSSNSYSPSYAASVAGLQALWQAGYTTAYGIYRLDNTETDYTKYYYRGTSTRRSTTMTYYVSDRYYYGTGTYSGGAASYNFSPEPVVTCAADESYSLVGWASSSGTTSTTDYEASVDGLKEYFFDGNTTAYGVYRLAGSSSTTTKYWYRGSSTRNSLTQTATTAARYYYGTGSSSGGGTSYSYNDTPTTSCASDSNYSLKGWTTSSSSTSTSYAASTAGLQSLWQAGNSTAYGVYQLAQSMTYYPQNGTTSSSSISTTNYYYGTGSRTSNRPTEPSLTYDNHVFQGWSTASTGTPTTWASLWDAGNRTVYAIWKSNNLIYYGLNGEWKLCTVYFGENDVWKEVPTIKFGINDTWKP